MAKMTPISKIDQSVKICAVIKGRTLLQVKNLLAQYPQIKIVAENRWPDCKEKFTALKKDNHSLERHFIGHLQSNKIKKVLSLVECIQSVDSKKLLFELEKECVKSDKKMDIFLQINISQDPKKFGFAPNESKEAVKYFISLNSTHLRLNGLMTIGEAVRSSLRKGYYVKLKALFDEINDEVLRPLNLKPMTYLSMGTSEDYEYAIEAGANMVRIGSALFE